MSRPSESPEADLQEALVVVPLLEVKLWWVKDLAAHSSGQQREERLWEADRLRRRIRYWRRRVVRLTHQLQEVSDDYPTTYLRVMRAAADQCRAQRGRPRQRQARAV